MGSHYESVMAIDPDTRRSQAGKRNAQQDWDFVKNIAYYKSDSHDGYEYPEALRDAFVARMKWIMRTGYDDAYRLSYIAELATHFADETLRRR